MDPIFDRFGRLVKSWFSEDDISDNFTPQADSDFKDAWEELEDYLSSDEFKADSKPDEGPYQKPSPSLPEHLKADYENLGVPLDASLADIKKAYKKKILTYHPDRFSADPVEQVKATRKAASINDSFRRIEEYFEVQS